jgi:hypothetical protein
MRKQSASIGRRHLPNTLFLNLVSIHGSGLSCIADYVVIPEAGGVMASMKSFGPIIATLKIWNLSQIRIGIGNLYYIR